MDYDGRIVVYDFGELDELMPSYAMTIHKSQGSEFPAVVIPLHTQHYVMLQRNLSYTAITRGKRPVVLVGTPKAAAIATKRGDAVRGIVLVSHAVVARAALARVRCAALARKRPCTIGSAIPEQMEAR